MIFAAMTVLSTTHKKDPLHTEVVQEIVDAVTSIDYGSVEVVIHDGRVVQIECRRKIRVNQGELDRKTVKL